MSVPTSRIIEYVESINQAGVKLKQNHALDPDTAERLLLDAECLGAAVMSYIFKQNMNHRCSHANEKH